MTNAEEQKREMEEEIKKLNAIYEKLKIEHDEIAKKNEAVLINNKQLEDQLREEKFLTQEAEEVTKLGLWFEKIFVFLLQMRDMLAQKKSELENLLGEYEQRLEDIDEQNQQLGAERTKLKNQIQEMEEQWVIGESFFYSLRVEERLKENLFTF